jgi:hypothetical protein
MQQYVAQFSKLLLAELQLLFADQSFSSPFAANLLYVDTCNSSTFAKASSHLPTTTHISFPGA